MRVLRALLIYLAAVFIGGALLAPWLYWLAQTLASSFPHIANSPFHRGSLIYADDSDLLQISEKTCGTSPGTSAGLSLFQLGFRRSDRSVSTHRPATAMVGYAYNRANESTRPAHAVILTAVCRLLYAGGW